MTRRGVGVPVTPPPGTPPAAEDPALAMVLVAVLRGARTYDELVTATGLSRATVHVRLVELRGLRAVTWEDGKKGTLRPSARVVGVEEWESRGDDGDPAPFPLPAP